MSRRDDRPPIVVIGAGAAGFAAAIFAARSGRSHVRSGLRVLLLERTRDGGRKILMSGGGRCNVLPSAIEPSQFVTASSPHTLKKLLLSWPLQEQRRFFEEELGLPLALEPETGKLFPVSNKSRDVRDRLRDMAERDGAELRFDSYVTGLEAESRTLGRRTRRLIRTRPPGVSGFKAVRRSARRASSSRPEGSRSRRPGVTAPVSTLFAVSAIRFTTPTPHSRRSPPSRTGTRLSRASRSP